MTYNFFQDLGINISEQQTKNSCCHVIIITLHTHDRITRITVNHIISSVTAITYLILIPQHLRLPGGEHSAWTSHRATCVPRVCPSEHGEVAPSEGTNPQGGEVVRGVSKSQR